MTVAIYLLFLFTVSAIAGAQAKPTKQVADTADKAGLSAIVRQVVADSVVSGGKRDGALLIPTDSTTAALMRTAGLPITPKPTSADVVCPGSTEKDGSPSPAPVGYWVSISLTGGGSQGKRELEVTKKCTFRYAGKDHGFGQAGTWEVLLEKGRWRLGRLLLGWIS